MKVKSRCLFFLFAFILCTDSFGGDVSAYIKDVELCVGKGKSEKKIIQKRWFLENDKVRLAVVDDPGGAVVEFTDKKTGVNHVAGEVYKTEKNGKVEKKAGWGWVDWFYDNSTDPKEKWTYYLPYKVEFKDGKGGAKSIKVTGQTSEQKVERTMTLKPGSAELSIHIKITNISERKRPLWLRWHPQIFPSGDVYGKSACVLSPGKGDQVRKIRTAWGWDHWFETVIGCWLAADFKSGDGVFCTFEKEKTPITLTWTQYKKGRPTTGAVSMEPFPRLKMTEPGGSIESTFTYFPFTKDTDPDKVPLGVIKDKKEQADARQFLKRAIKLEHLEKFGGYTFARSEYFDWQHRRRDLFGLRDWGFADCAIMGYPLQEKALKIRMRGGIFSEAQKMKGFPKWNPGINYRISVKNQDNDEIYKSNFLCKVSPGVPGLETYDRELAVPMTNMPDGSYTLTVEAIDPITRKPFHRHQRKVEVIGNRLKSAASRFERKSKTESKDRLFVTALRKIKDIDIKEGRVEIPVGVEDASDCDRKNFPVTLGVPFPIGAFKTDAQAKLLSPDGKVVPAQFRVMNIWPDKSLKWLQVDFQADCPADSFAFYKLEVGKVIDKERSGKSLIDEDAGLLKVDTGVMQVIIDPKSSSISCQVFIDSNRNGKFEEDEKVTDKSLFENSWWEDADKRMAYMKITGKQSGIFKPGVSIEENGDLCAVVKIQGWYINEKDRKTPAYGELRLKFFKNKARINVWHQVTFTGSPWTDKLASYGMRLKMKSGIYSKLDFDIDNKRVTEKEYCKLYQSSSDRVSLTVNGKTVAKGNKSDGAVMMSGKDNSFLFYHKNLWQMYPKKIVADASKGELAISYWPKEAGVHTFAPDDEYWIPSSSSAEACGTGASRTQEMTLDFTPAIGVVKAPKYFGEPVIACTPPAWVQKTKVLGNLQPYNPEIAPDIEEFMKTYIDFHKRNRELFKFYGHWNYGTLHNVYRTGMYQWLLVGRYANIGNEEDIVQAPWLLYFRSGDRKYLKFAELWTRHLMEVQSIRWHDLYPKAAGMSRRHHYTTWLGNADYGHTMLCPYLEYYHATGYRPAWEMAEMAAKAMRNTYDGTWRYLSNPIIGSIRMYLETGEDHYKKTADRIWRDLCYPDKNEWWGASHGGRMVRWYAPFNEECMKSWKEWTKKGAPVKSGVYKYPFRYVDSLAEMGEMTNDLWYAHMARVNYNRELSQYTGLIHGVNPIFRGMVPYTMNTQYYMGLVRMLATGKGQIVKSRKSFPAGFYHFGKVKGVVIKENKDGEFKIFASGASEKTFNVVKPNGQPADIVVKEVFNSKEGSKSVKFFKITVKKDGITGMYQIRPFNLDYWGCSLKDTAIIVGNKLKGSGDTLYVRSNDLGAPEMKIIMNGYPGCSLELFSLGGKRIFSRSMVRPESDAVGVVVDQKIPANTVLRLGDRTGILFKNVKSIPLYLNKDGIFNIPKEEKEK